MTTLIGLLGWPVEHSISPSIHNAVFQSLGIDWRYERLPVRPEELADKFEQFAEDDYRGFNITIPHKQRALALPQIEKVEGEAQAIGAANTLALNDSGGWQAGNTDWEGFMLDLQRNQIDVEGKNCLLLGWGGAARGVRFALQRLGAASVWALSRRPDEAAQVFPYRALPDLAAKADLIVNCTPLGMPPYQDASPWPEQIEFPKRAVLYDLIYIPAVTRLMHTAQDAGARAIGGIGMLAYQAALSFQKWTGEEPPFDLYLEAARNALVAEVP